MGNTFPPRNCVRALYKYKGTGLPRIAEFVRRMYAKRYPNAEVIIDDFMGVAKFSCSLGEHMGSQIYWRGDYSGPQLRLLASLLRPGGVFIDLGANQGEFSVYAACLVGEEGRVYAFEPSPLMQERLRKNIQINDIKQVIIEPVAVADKPGHATLYSPDKMWRDGTYQAGLFTLYPQTDRADCSAIKVAVTTLDAWLRERNPNRVDVIKMDIEGAELPALKGGLQLIEQFRPSLIIELNDTSARAAGYSTLDVVTWLEEHHYDIFLIEENGRLHPLYRDRLASFQNIMARPRS